LLRIPSLISISGKADLERGADYEVKLDFGRFFYGERYGTWADVRVVYIKTADSSYMACEQGTDIQAGEVAFLDESICVSTSAGRWAILKVVDAETSSRTGNITFDVQLFSA
jgi:hypothetical protein